MVYVIIARHSDNSGFRVIGCCEGKPSADQIVEFAGEVDTMLVIEAHPAPRIYISVEKKNADV